MRKELVIQKTKSQDREAETIFFTRASKLQYNSCLLYTSDAADE